MKTKVSQERTTKKMGVLLYPQLRSRSTRRGRGGARGAEQPHFSQQTMSSQRRQQPPQQRYLWQQQPRQPTYSPIKISPAMLHSSTPLVLQREEEREKVLQQLVKKHHKEAHLSSPPSTPLRDDREEDKAISAAQPAASSNSQMAEKRIHIATFQDKEESGSSSPRSPGDEQQRLWMESIAATLAHHSKQLETFKTATEKQLSQLQQKLSSKAKSEKRHDEIDSSPPKIVCESSKGKEKDSTYDRKTFEGLVERLRELEGEEEVIRERWRTVAYEDPPFTKPLVVYSAEDTLSGEKGELFFKK